VGAETTKFKVGDEVFGGARGSLAEYGSAKTLARKPANLTWEEAAAIPIAGLTALQGLRDKGNLHPGQAVLVNGAAGGVGTFTVQIAKTLGAEVTAVCGTRNVDLVRSLGADHVVDYTKEDFATSHKKYDVVFDVVGNRSLGALRRLAKPEGTVVLCGGGHQKGHGQSLLLTISRIGRAAILAKISKKPRMVFFIAKFNDDDLATLGDMAELGTLKPAVERAYTLDQAAEAFRYLKSGHVQAKLVFTVSGG
jgi:NADPH:quinone reductase-like Zn-dependent oxidoreductase